MHRQPHKTSECCVLASHCLFVPFHSTILFCHLSVISFQFIGFPASLVYLCALLIATRLSRHLWWRSHVATFWSIRIDLCMLAGVNLKLSYRWCSATDEPLGRACQTVPHAQLLGFFHLTYVYTYSIWLIVFVKHSWKQRCIVLSCYTLLAER